MFVESFYSLGCLKLTVGAVYFAVFVAVGADFFTVRARTVYPCNASHTAATAATAAWHVLHLVVRIVSISHGETGTAASCTCSSSASVASRAKRRSGAGATGANRLVLTVTALAFDFSKVIAVCAVHKLFQNKLGDFYVLHYKVARRKRK